MILGTRFEICLTRLHLCGTLGLHSYYYFIPYLDIGGDGWKRMRFEEQNVGRGDGSRWRSFEEEEKVITSNLIV